MHSNLLRFTNEDLIDSDGYVLASLVGHHVFKDSQFSSMQIDTDTLNS